MRPTKADPPVPYSSHRPNLFQRTGTTSQSPQNLAAMGAVGTLFAIVNLTSTSVADLTWRLYRKAKSGRPEDRVEVTSHLALDVLNQPNDFYSREELFEAVQQHIDLTGEGWLVCQTLGSTTWPASLWPVRPDRITPIPSAESFLAGYVYRGPDGEDIPLGLDQVMRIRMPNPMDPYRGLGPVQAVLTDADSIRYSAEWNRNFFFNGAEPGGIVEIENRLSDVEFNEMRARWQEQHRGVSNAHRVAIIEQGHWVDRKYSHNDMQFAQLREVSESAIRKAFITHPHMLGESDDVNLANATAAEVTFARRSTVPRANRWRGMLNRMFLPKFYPPGAKLDVEFDYDNPVAEDEAQDAENFLNRSRGVQLLVTSGFDGSQAAAAAGLPEIGWDADAVVRSSTEIAAPADKRTAPTNVLRPVAAAQQPTGPDDIDLTPVQEAWLYALNGLLAQWAAEVTAPQRAALAEQVARIIDGGDLTDLADMHLDTAEGTALLKVAMQGLADLSGNHIVQEAARQGVVLEAAAAAGEQLGEWAGLTADLLALGLRIAAAREAMRVASPGLSGAEVAHQVQQYLAALSDASVRDQLGGALTAAQNAGRFATIRKGPEAALYASEKNDANTCGPCREVNGRFLGNVSELPQVERTYPSSGYVGCLGGVRCRGTVVAVWRPKTVDDGGDE